MRVLTFSAILHGDGALELAPGFVAEGEPSTAKGELTVEALGRGGRPLAKTPLALETPCTPPGGEPERAAFGLVAFPATATGLRVSLKDKVLLERTAPREKLDVRVEWPGALSGVTSVGWETPIEGCVASVGYSNDGGATWTPLALPGGGGRLEFDTALLPGGRDGLLELVVTDGLRTQRIRSGPYEVEPKGWVVWLLAPAAGARLPAGQPVLLAAQAYHLEERRPAYDEIAWESSRAGALGIGARVLAALEPGEHSITARMHDASAEVAVSVG
jgi:hypothetical protein